jgi:hypothetical protein
VARAQVLLVIIGGLPLIGVFLLISVFSLIVFRLRSS